MVFADVMSSMGAGFVEIGRSFINDLSIFWLVTPIFAFWIVLEVYFSRYQSEKLGWNTALGNGMSIFWILIVSMRELFSVGLENVEWSKFGALLILCAYTIFIIYNSFTHRLPEKVSYVLASPTITYFLSGIAILWTFGGLTIHGWVVLDLILIYALVLLVEWILKEIVAKNSGFSEANANSLSGSDLN